MPNVDNPHGLRPLMRTLGGGFPTVAKFSKAVGYATAIFMWDAINRVADGSIEASATPGTTLYSGVALEHGAASKATRHLSIVSPDAVFEAQDEGTGIAAADVGLNANLVLNAGNANTLVSGHEINGATKAATATLDLKIIELLADPNNAFGANGRFQVVINKHRMHPAVAGV